MIHSLYTYSSTSRALEAMNAFALIDDSILQPSEKATSSISCFEFTLVLTFKPINDSLIAIILSSNVSSNVKWHTAFAVGGADRFRILFHQKLDDLERAVRLQCHVQNSVSHHVLQLENPGTF